MDALVTRIYNIAKNSIKEKTTLNVNDIIALIPILMDAVKEYPNLQGSEKRKIVLDVIAHIINEEEVPLSPDLKEMSTTILKSELFGIIIDNLWMAAKGTLFTLVGKDGKCDWKKLFCCCCKKE